MKTEDLMHMANQIAANIQADTEEAAVMAIADHLRKFWEPRMRRDLRTAITAGEAAGLSGLVMRALDQV